MEFLFEKKSFEGGNRMNCTNIITSFIGMILLTGRHQIIA